MAKSLATIGCIAIAIAILVAGNHWCLWTNISEALESRPTSSGWNNDRDRNNHNVGDFVLELGQRASHDDIGIEVVAIAGPACPPRVSADEDGSSVTLRFF